MLQWARERARLSVDALSRRFAQLPAWERGEAQPTFKQLQAFAQATHVPFGYLFLPEPPQEPLPIRDFRTVQNRPIGAISTELRETIQAMQRRQDWLREERRDNAQPPLAFVGSARPDDDPEAIGREMRRVLGLGAAWAASMRTWQEAVGRLRAAIEALGVMAVINGIVGNDTHRSLDVAEFRGFALSDPLAPLLFVNGADAKSAQMFTLAHELAHLWLGEAGQGLSGFVGLFPEGGKVERFCDRAAAECLVPATELSEWWPTAKREESPFERLARRFKVSPIVVARRALDLRLIERAEFFAFYEAYVQRERKAKADSSGGDFYRSQNARVGVAFAREVIRAAREGRIGFKQAYELTGLNGGAFQEYARRLEAPQP